MGKRRIAEKGRRKGRKITGRKKRYGKGRDTRVVSLQRIALWFPPRSLQQVYFHALWQRTRGRQPSLPLENMHNPRVAFATATQLEGRYLETVRHLPRFRQKSTWKNSEQLVQVIIDHKPIEQIASMF